MFLFILSMHVVSTLLSRLLFLTVCIFIVNTYPIYQSVYFSVSHAWRRQAGVLWTLLNCHALPPPTLRSEHCKSEHTGQTDVASATYRTETMPGFVSPTLPPPPPPPPPTTTTKSQLLLQASLCGGENRQHGSLFAPFCIEWSRWNVRNVCSRGRPRTL